MRVYEINESYQHWIEGYENGPVVRVSSGDTQVPPDYLYRVMSREEYETAKQLGEFRPRRGERIHASSRPHNRYGSGIDAVVIRFRYDDADGWRAKWGDELYAVTDEPIPFSRATLIS